MVELTLKECFGWTQKVIDEYQIVDMPTLEKISELFKDETFRARVVKVEGCQ